MLPLANEVSVLVKYLKSSLSFFGSNSMALSKFPTPWYISNCHLIVFPFLEKIALGLLNKADLPYFKILINLPLFIEIGSPIIAS